MKKKEKRKESASSINYEILLRKKRVERDLEENISPFLVESKTVLTFALRGPATSSPGTMHANYQAAIMIRSCRRADEGTSWLLYTHTRTGGGAQDGSLLECNEGCSFEKGGGSRKDGATSGSMKELQGIIKGMRGGRRRCTEEEEEEGTASFEKLERPNGEMQLKLVAVASNLSLTLSPLFDNSEIFYASVSQSRISICYF